jgi:hypothetical protein
MPRSGSSRQARKPRQHTHRLTWRHAQLEVRHTPDYLGEGSHHIEVIVKAPKGAPIPITHTGYRSQFVEREELKAAGGAVAYVRDWLDREARQKAWEAIEFKWRQLELELLQPASAPKRPPRQPVRLPRRRAGQGTA